MTLGTGALSGLRLAATSSVPIYGTVCYVKRYWLKQRIDYPHAGTDLCVEGYRSSGNTFATEAIQQKWPGLSVASHRHCVAAVLRASSLGKPIIVLTREPEEAISSCVVRFGWPVRFALADYIHFYSCTRGIPGVHYFDFARLLAQPRELIGLVQQLTGAVAPEGGAQTSEDFRARRAQSMQQWSVNPEQWWIPHPEKDRRKHAIKAQLGAHARELEHARTLYAGLCEPAA